MKNIKFAKSEEKKWTKNKKNKVFLGIFLGLIFITILMKVLVTILWDIGYYNGHTHLWYWKDKDVMEILEKSKWGSDRISGPDIKQELARRALTHPYFFWSLTQFTWQTTLIVTFVIILRFFMYDDKIPKWLSWTHSQKTLSLVTMYDVIVCIVFWSALAKTFSIDRGSSDELMNFLISASTILVHAVIPAIMVIYSLISLLFLSEASRLKRKFVFTAMIYPIIYIIAKIKGINQLDWSNLPILFNLLMIPIKEDVEQNYMWAKKTAEDKKKYMTKFYANSMFNPSEKPNIDWSKVSFKKTKSNGKTKFILTNETNQETKFYEYDDKKLLVNEDTLLGTTNAEELLCLLIYSNFIDHRENGLNKIKTTYNKLGLPIISNINRIPREFDYKTGKLIDKNPKVDQQTTSGGDPNNLGIKTKGSNYKPPVNATQSPKPKIMSLITNNDEPIIANV